MVSVSYVCLLGFFLGVAMHSLRLLPWWSILFILLVPASLLTSASFGIQKLGNITIGRHIRYLSLLLIGVSLGVLRCEITDLRSPKYDLDQQVGHFVELEGTIVELPQERGQVRRALFHPDGGAAKISVSVPLYPTIRYGDRLRVSGVLVKPEAFLSDNGRFFDYPKYLALSDVYYQIKSTQFTIIGREKMGGVRDGLSSLRADILSRIGDRFMEPEYALLAGLLLGEKSALGQSLENAFRRVGVIHIVVLSGFNITIIGTAVMYMLSAFPRRFGIVFGIVFMILFSVMVGASATVVRSAIMAILALVATLFYRTYDVRRALFLAAFLMVLYKPGLLMFDPSFQLSFLSTVGLIYLSPLIERRLMWCHEIPRTIIVATLSTQLFVLPYLLYSMGNISIVSVFANLAILPIVPFAMLVGFVAILLPSAVSLVPVAIAHFFLTYIFSVVRFFASVPFATITTSYFPAWLMVGWYGMTGGLLFWKYGRSTHAQ